MADTENGTTEVHDADIKEEKETPTEIIRDSILDTEEMKKLFVGGIAQDAKDEELKAFFENICSGTVTDHVIIRKDKEKKSHFGFVTFASSELVDTVLSKRKELVFNGKALDVNRAVPKNNTSPGAHEKTKKLFIANLPKHGCTEEDLKKYFEARHDPQYGCIESVQLIKKKDEKGNKTDENKGFGFVMVSSEDMADKMAIQHATFDFGGRKIELKKICTYWRWSSWWKTRWSRCWSWCCSRWPWWRTIWRWCSIWRLWWWIWRRLWSRMGC